VPSLELVYDPDFRWFLARVGVSLARQDSPLGESLPSSFAEWTVVDSGSNVTVLSSNLAARLGIQIDGLETRNLGGATGVARRPFVRDVEVFVGGMVEGRVRLPVAAIALPTVLRDMGRMAPASWKGTWRGGPLSILGTDVARAPRPTLSLDFKELKGALEW
jgi:hypothetical protein